MSKFQYIDSQIRIAKKIVASFESGINTVVLDLPTGGGKSGIAYLVHELSGHSTITMMHQKILQDQYEELFLNNSNVVSVKGKSNYQCKLASGLSVPEAPCQYRGKCSIRSGCEYFLKRDQMKTMPFVVTNYHLVFSLLDINAFESSKKIAVYDEFHNLESLFTNYRKVSLSQDILKKFKLIKPFFEKFYPENKKIVNLCIKALLDFDIADYLHSFETVFNSFTRFSQFVIDSLSDKDQMLWLLEKDKKGFYQLSNLIDNVNNLKCKWTNYQTYQDQVRFIFETNSYDEFFEYSLSPLSVATMFTATANFISPKRLLMSSTVFNYERMLDSLGISRESSNLISVPSRFPVENRSVFFMNAESLNNKKLNDVNYNLDNFFALISDICEAHAKKQESGVIFTSSYKLAEMVYDRLQLNFKNQGFFLLRNSDSSERNSVIESFRNTKISPRLLISPSFFEGVNFEDDISRFQIIVKAPFQSLGSEFVRAKMKQSRYWYEISTLSDIVQACGRSVRNEKDHATTYIMDKNATRVYNTYLDEIPTWFKKAVQIL